MMAVGGDNFSSIAIYRYHRHNESKRGRLLPWLSSLIIENDQFL
jgi:hypothetical protein